MSESSCESEDDLLLIEACLTGDYEKVEQLLGERGMDPNPENENGETPLHIASANGFEKIVLLLLSSPYIQPNSLDDEGTNALYHACKSQNAKIVQILLQDGRVDPNIQDNEEQLTPLHVACNNNDILCVSFLLEDVRIDIGVEDENGNTALHNACHDGRVEITKLLMSHKNVNVNSMSRTEKSTPLHEACSSGHSELVKILLDDVRVDPNVKDGDGDTPLQSARSYSQRNIVEYLQSSPRVRQDENELNTKSESSGEEYVNERKNSISDPKRRKERPSLRSFLSIKNLLKLKR